MPSSADGSDGHIPVTIGIEIMIQTHLAIWFEIFVIEFELDLVAANSKKECEAFVEIWKQFSGLCIACQNYTV